MNIPAQTLPCDGCGFTATPQHIAARIRRLELATQFRPIHIGILFVAFAPPTAAEDDFYTPPRSSRFFDLLLEGLGISAAPAKAAPNAEPQSQDSDRLSEFQRRGHFLAHLSECPMLTEAQSAAESITRLAPNLIRRIRFNYKPKYIALLGTELAPLVEVLRSAGLGPSLILHRGLPLPLPGTGAKDWQSLFQSAVASAAPSQNPQPGYDRIASSEVGNPGAGGGA